MMNPYFLAYNYLKKLNEEPYKGNQEEYIVETHFDKLLEDGIHATNDEIVQYMLSYQPEGEPASGSQSAEAVPAAEELRSDTFEVDYNGEAEREASPCTPRLSPPPDEVLAGKIEGEKRKQALKGFSQHLWEHITGQMRMRKMVRCGAPRHLSSTATSR